MLNINSVNIQTSLTNNELSKTTTKESINTLPQELFDNIFSYLDKNDLQSTVCANKYLRVMVLKVVDYNIKRFVSSLRDRLTLKKCHSQRDLLIQISQNITFQNSLNLRLLKDSILQLKVQLINIIKTLDVKTENDLKAHASQLPHFMEDIFELAAFEKQIDAANCLPDESVRGCALEDISKALANAGHIDRAIEVATLIPDENLRKFAINIHMAQKAIKTYISATKRTATFIKEFKGK